MRSGSGNGSANQRRGLRRASDRTVCARIGLIVLLLSGLLLALAQVTHLLGAHPSGTVTTASAVLMMAGAALLPVAVLVPSVARLAEEHGQRRQGLKALIVGSILLCVGLIWNVAGSTLAAPLPANADVLLQLLGFAASIYGLALMSWPRRQTAAERRIIAIDSVVGAIALAVVWWLGVIPALTSNVSGGSRGFLVAGALWLGAVLLVVLASSARRRSVLPMRQLVLLQGAAALYVLVGVVQLTVDRSGLLPTPLPLLGYWLAAACFIAFLGRPADETEGPFDAAGRQFWALLIPLGPIPFAAILLLEELGGSTSGPASTMAGLLLVALMLGVVVLRVLSSRELQRSAERVIEANLERRQEDPWFRQIAASSNEYVCLVDNDSRVVYANPNTEAMLSQACTDLRLWDVIRASDEPAEEVARALLARAYNIPAGQSTSAVVWMPTELGPRRKVRWTCTRLQGSELPGFSLVGRDVTEEERWRELVARAGNRDRLTGLLTRAGVVSSDQETMGLEPGTALLAIDIRGFRGLNDARGNAVGDAALRHVAASLDQVPRRCGPAARIGSDEFVVPVGGAPAPVAAAAARAALAELLRDADLAGTTVTLEFACGYATAGAGMSPEELLSRADLALAQSRRTDGQPLVRYEAGLRSALAAEHAAEVDLRDALDSRSLAVRYQPIVRLSDVKVVGAEALVRRRRPDGTLEGPASLVSTAERLGLVDEVDHRVLCSALSDFDEITRITKVPLRLNVNVSQAELSEGLAERIGSALAASTMGADRLTLEVTEGTLAKRPEEAVEVLRTLREQGCRIALDDFGTGYSSMAVLAELPVDVLKIDASFVRKLGSTRRGVSVMRAIVDVGRALSLGTVAEGITRVEQVDLLRGLGCEYGQGFLFAEPMSAQALAEYLGRRHDPADAGHSSE